jgi:hypothetical protein
MKVTAVVKRVDGFACGEREKLIFAAPQRAARIGGTCLRSFATLDPIARLA